MSKIERFTSVEKTLLISLILERRHIVECKKSDTYTINKKKKAWKEIETSYNALENVTKRTWQQLKKFWSNEKQHRKKILFAEAAKGGNQPQVSPFNFESVTCFNESNNTSDMNDEAMFQDDVVDDESNTGIFEETVFVPSESSMEVPTSNNGDRDPYNENEMSRRRKIVENTDDGRSSPDSLVDSGLETDQSRQHSTLNLEEEFKKYELHERKVKLELLQKELETVNLEIKWKREKHELNLKIQRENHSLQLKRNEEAHQAKERRLQLAHESKEKRKNELHDVMLKRLERSRQDNN